MNQGDAFRNGEGDAWFHRNKAALDRAEADDMPLRLLAEGIPPLDHRSTVFEIGCANGWRLRKLYQRYGCHGYGIDVSKAAIQDGYQWPVSLLSIAPASDALHFAPHNIDLTIVYFVFHWIDRVEMMASLESIDSCVPNRGFLLIGDFLPEIPTEVPYHHQEGLFTFKADYISPFLAAGYRIRKEIIFNHDTNEVGDLAEIPDHQRAHCTLLQKVYQWET
ncbi:hypothetical protein LCGC14_0313370 [marine sediment metagenome]|uniref:Methyltransferase type 11 domain-containing protein n=1 Tax=marine sediment metagenome TaxID=412755 RepID=A0A0F9TLP2_9ZZZZ